MSIIKEKQDQTFETLKSEFEYKNKMQSPKLEKVVLNVGTGSTRIDKKKIELIEDRLIKIAGQKPAYRKAKNLLQLLN